MPIRVPMISRVLGVVALALMLLVATASPAFALFPSIAILVDCDEWTASATNIPDGHVVTISIDGDTSAFSGADVGSTLPQIGGEWQSYQDTHRLTVYLHPKGSAFDTGLSATNAVDQCPEFPPAGAMDVQATCDGWSVTLSGWDAGDPTTVTADIDSDVPVVNTSFTTSFSRTGEWSAFASEHRIDVVVTRSGPSSFAADTASGCPTSAPTTTAAPTTSQATTTTVEVQAEDSTTTSDATTTTIAPVDSTTTIAEGTTTTTLESAVDQVIVAGDVDAGSGGGMGSIVLGMLMGLGLAGVAGGAWYLGKRSAG